MSHASSEAATVGARTCADQTAHLGAALAFPDLCRLRPALTEPLEHLRQAAWQEVENITPSLGTCALLSCARDAFVELQGILAAYEGVQLPRPIRFQTWGAQGVILVALPGRVRELKELQVAAGAGKPLTICFGHRARQLPLAPPFHYLAYHEGDGCGLVYADATGLRRPTFRLYCRNCSKQTTLLDKKALADAQALSQGRHRVLILNEHGLPIPGWTGSCSSCTRGFVSASAKVRRCDRCRHGHRAPKIRAG